MNFIANCCYPHIRTKINLFFLLCVSGFIFSCNTTKNLKSGETLLTQNKIELLDISTLNEKILFKQELGTLFKQKPNRTYLFFLSVMPFTIISKQEKIKRFGLENLSANKLNLLPF